MVRTFARVCRVVGLGASVVMAGHAYADGRRSELPEHPVPYDGVSSAADAAWNDGRLYEHLERFVGARRGGGYIEPGWSAAKQVAAGLSGPPGDKVRLGDGARLLHACRLHSCDEKAAVVVSRDNRIAAAGLIHFRCHDVVSAAEQRRRPKSGIDCDKAPTLTLFLSRDLVWRDALEAWAQRAVNGEIRTEVVLVDGARR